MTQTRRELRPPQVRGGCGPDSKARAGTRQRKASWGVEDDDVPFGAAGVTAGPGRWGDTGQWSGLGIAVSGLGGVGGYEPHRPQQPTTALGFRGMGLHPALGAVPGVGLGGTVHLGLAPGTVSSELGGPGPAVKRDGYQAGGLSQLGRALSRTPRREGLPCRGSSSAWELSWTPQSWQSPAAQHMASKQRESVFTWV